ncbi:Putative ribonuclease H protein At1g65750, partial [Linum perenne]
VWKWKGSQRIRQFLWLAIKDRLLTNLERNRRHLAGNVDCGICPGTHESCIHILRDCPLAKQVCEKTLGISRTYSFFSPSREEWWNSNLTNDEAVNFFGNTCWVLWKTRNEHIFEGKTALRQWWQEVDIGVILLALHSLN